MNHIYFDFNEIPNKLLDFLFALIQSEYIVLSISFLRFLEEISPCAGYLLHPPKLVKENNPICDTSGQKWIFVSTLTKSPINCLTVSVSARKISKSLQEKLLKRRKINS